MLRYRRSIDSLDMKISQMILIGFLDRKVDEKYWKKFVRGGGIDHNFEKIFPQKILMLNWRRSPGHISVRHLYRYSSPLIRRAAKVNRLKEKSGFQRSVTAARLGKFTPDSFSLCWNHEAATLAGLGINVNFAPVVDLTIDPNNPAIVKPERAFFPHGDFQLHYSFGSDLPTSQTQNYFGTETFPGHGSSKMIHIWVLLMLPPHGMCGELYPYRSLIDSGEVWLWFNYIVNKKFWSSIRWSNQRSWTWKQLQLAMEWYFQDDMQMHAIAKHRIRDRLLTRRWISRHFHPAPGADRRQPGDY